MKRTYADMVGEYYDNLDAAIDIEASEMGSYLDESGLKKLIFYSNAAR